MGNQRVFRAGGHLWPHPAPALPHRKATGAPTSCCYANVQHSQIFKPGYTDSLYSHTCRKRPSGELKSAGSKLANVGEVCHGNQTPQTEPELPIAQLE